MTTTHSARIIIDPRFTVGDVPARLFGGFVEQAGRAVYHGLYEPGHETADANGFRLDVMDAIARLGITTVRYPGGNYVSGHRWEDGTGPRENRPARPELAWHATETNAFGLDEFFLWSRAANIEPMLAVNLGTRGVLEALDMLEYTNGAGGTFQADRRRANGFETPLEVRMWCLGNEPDGPWQLGHTDALHYGRTARQTAQAMRMYDPRLELVVAGSSGNEMPTFGSWERTVLEETFDDVDFISVHQYYSERDDDLDGYLASSVDFDAYIHTVEATIDHVASVKRSRRRVDISVDEWGVWYQEKHRDEVPSDQWPIAGPRLEEHYSVADAAVYGSMLITLLRHVDRVRAASAAQLVNVIAPIMTVSGGGLWTQTIFHPFAAASARVGDIVLTTNVTASVLRTERFGEVPVLDAVVLLDPVTGDIRVFAVNRSSTAPIDVELDLSSFGRIADADARTLADVDPRRQGHGHESDPRPRALTVTVEQGRSATAILPPASWTEITLRPAAGRG